MVQGKLSARFFRIIQRQSIDANQDIRCSWLLVSSGLTVTSPSILSGLRPQAQWLQAFRSLAVVGSFLVSAVDGQMWCLSSGTIVGERRLPSPITSNTFNSDTNRSNCNNSTATAIATTTTSTATNAAGEDTTTTTT